MSKRRPQLDSAGLKGPEISFHRILIVVGSCVSGRGKGLDYVKQLCGRHSSNTYSQPSRIPPPRIPHPLKLLSVWPDQ
jgi:hypothetical protein